jgi:3-mercaptopyruvate sulfurtransferase SseA
MEKLNLLPRGAFLLLAAGLGIACQQPTATITTTASSGQPNAPIANAAPAPTQNAEDSMPRVRVEEAKAAVEKGEAVIIDVRGPDSYKAAHIKGSIEHVLSKLEQGDFKGLPKDKRIIAYCS